MNKQSKPTIETVINTAAIALTTSGVTFLTIQKDWWGFLLVLFGAALEWFKYWGRQKLW